MDEFLALLEEKGIQHLVDVRSYPSSKREEFNKDQLKETLFHKSILYKHFNGLGGMKEGDYHDSMETDEWKEQYGELKELAEEGKTAIMCLEKDPMRCHRRHIAERLEEEGWEVIHIGKGGSWKEKKLDDF